MVSWWCWVLGRAEEGDKLAMSYGSWFGEYYCQVGLLLQSYLSTIFLYGGGHACWLRSGQLCASLYS